MPEIRDGYEVESYAASEAEPGWKLLYDGQVFEMVRREFRPARRGEDRRLKIFVDRDPGWFIGEESQTIYRVLGPAT